MTSQIVSNTPLWVWGILLALLWIGSVQLVPRVTRLGRVLRVALLMAGFSVYGTVAALGPSLIAMACWTGAVAGVAFVVLHTPLPAGTFYRLEQRKFELPGSWVPLALMLGLFAVKYLAGVLLALHSPWVQSPLFAPLLGAVYGAFSGAFLGRAGRLLRLAQQARPQAMPA